MDHAGTKIWSEKQKLILKFKKRNEKNVECRSYDFVATSEKNPFNPLIKYSNVQQ